jgi:hypothetical protein
LRFAACGLTIEDIFMAVMLQNGVLITEFTAFNR